jgi:hypothetical protein
MPKLTNLRHDPFERMNWPAKGFAEGSIAYWDSFKHEMWRYQIVAQFIPKYAESFIEFPPMQAGASFNAAGELKEKIKQAAEAAAEHQD